MKGVVLVIILIAGIWLWNDHQEINKLKSENSALESDNRYLTMRANNFSDALDEANNNIEEGNTNIINAQSAMWGTYDDMGYALEELTQIDTVSSPY